MEQTFPLQSTMDDLIKAPTEFNIVPRAEWTDSQSNNPEEVFLPAKKVIINLDKRFKPCVTREQCVERMQEIEAHFLQEKGCPVIPYSFIVANDGLVYEGRGWKSRPQRSLELKEFEDETVEILLLAVNSCDTEAQNAPELSRYFVLDCVEKGMIVQDHDVRCFCGDERLF